MLAKFIDIYIFSPFTPFTLYDYSKTERLVRLMRRGKTILSFKKIFFMFLGGSLVFVTVHLLFTGKARASDLQIFADKRTVNVYRSPQLQNGGKVLKSIAGGQTLEVLPINDVWDRTAKKINGQYGYVDSSDVLKDDTGVSQKVYSIGKATKIYKTPYPYEEKNSLYETIKGTEPFIVRKMDKNWYKTFVRINGKEYTGYVSRSGFDFAVPLKNHQYRALKTNSDVYADTSDINKTIIKMLNQNDVIYGQSFTENWDRVTVNGRTCFINNRDFEQDDSFEGNSLVAFGDSMTRGAEADTDRGTTKYSWTTYLPHEIGASKVYNYGVSGSAVAVRSNRKDSFQERESWINSNSKHPDTILVLVSINDFRHNVPLGSFNIRSRTTFYGGLRNFTEYLLRNDPKSKIIYMTPLIENRPPVSTYQHNIFGLNQTDYARAIKKVTSYYGIECIDMQTWTGLNPFNPAIKKAYYVDGLHMNKAGYRIMSAEISRRLLNG